MSVMKREIKAIRGFKGKASMEAHIAEMKAKNALLPEVDTRIPVMEFKIFTEEDYDIVHAFFNKVMTTPAPTLSTDDVRLIIREEVRTAVRELIYMGTHAPITTPIIKDIVAEEIRNAVAPHNELLMQDELTEQAKDLPSYLFPSGRVNWKHPDWAPVPLAFDIIDRYSAEHEGFILTGTTIKEISKTLYGNCKQFTGLSTSRLIAEYNKTRNLI